MVLSVNGETREVASNTIPRLLEELGYEADFLAVAVNTEVVPRRRWMGATLAEGDRVEIVTPRQGG